MYLLYSLLLTFGFILLLPRFLYDALKKGKYAAGFWQRLGYIPEFTKSVKPILWLHCVSVGETNAALPLAKEILKRHPNYRLVVSTTTNTGQDLAQKLYGDLADLIFYFPFDWKFTVRRTLNKIKPNIVLLMETELWFNFIREADKTGTLVFIVNGRLSEKSLNRYLYIKKFMARVLHHITLTLMQNKVDANRIKQLGINKKKIKVTGNIKFDQSLDGMNDRLTLKLKNRFDISEEVPLIIAVSTHSPEEELILEAFKIVSTKLIDISPVLLLVPRHPERFEKVAEIIKSSIFEYAIRSENPLEKDKNARVILLDSIGELRSFLPLAEIVFVGGSLIPHGGQNILEPAIVKKTIVTGFYTMNFDAIVKEFLKQNALIQLPELDEKEVPEKLAEVLIRLLQDGEKRAKLAGNAFAVMQKNRGATKQTVEYLEPFLSVQSKT
jgi:3-deoxy-D-manno-octulosonic-acid transferase